MRWKATTVKKPVGDDVAAKRIMDVLNATAKACK